MCDDMLGFTQNSVVHGGARGFAIALLIQSLDGSLWDFYRVKISIALAIHSLNPIQSLDLSTRLIPAYGLGVERLSAQRNCCAFA